MNRGAGATGRWKIITQTNTMKVSFLCSSAPSCWRPVCCSRTDGASALFRSSYNTPSLVSTSSNSRRSASFKSLGSNLNRLFGTTSSTESLMTPGNTTNSKLSSKRGRDAPTYLPSYLRDARDIEIYHPLLRPNGAIQLSVAENYMMEDLLVPAFRDESSSVFTSDLIYYQSTQGREDLRRILCSSYLPHLLNSPPIVLNPNNLVVGAGCNAVLENTCFCLAEFGQGVMIPTPYYAAFEFDLTCRIGLKIIPVPPYPSLHDCTPSLEAYYPTYASLENAYLSAEESGIVPRILLLSHPNNPLGIIYPKQVLDDILDWCVSRDIHLVSDEIYAGSVYPSTNQSTSSYKGTEFSSMLQVIKSRPDYEYLKSRVHWIYALSKDFCASGLRVGMCYTENEDILYPLQKLNDLCQVSSITQSILVKLLDTTTTKSDDDGFNPVSFLKEARNRLHTRSKHVQQYLEILGIPTLPSEAGMFIWMDMQEFLPFFDNDDDDEKRENMLYKELVQHGLLFTPGLSMKMELPGFFRFIFTAVKGEDVIDLALQRLKTFVEFKRSSQ